MIKTYCRPAALLLLVLAGPATAAEPVEQRSTLQDQQSVAVTIYNDGLALIKDLRQVQLASGQNTLAFRDVSAQIRPETALLRSVSHPGQLSVFEQNFDFDLLTPQKLLEKYVGKSVQLVTTNPATGSETRETAQVLSANSGVVLKVGDRIETGMPGRIVYPDVPTNLRDRPTLVMLLNNSGAAQQQLELSYLSGGLSWRADYVAELNSKDDRLDLAGWVTLNNASGADYRNARLQLVAGDVNRVREERLYSMAKGAMDTAMPAPAPRMAEESLLEFHLYSLDRPTTIADNQTKQVSLLSAVNVPVRKELLLHGADYYYRASYGDLGQKIKVGVFVEFDNKESAQLGLPLPKGIMRVYKKDGAGNAQFVGEDRIDHTPKNEKVRLKLGEAFDVTADKKQTDFKRIPDPASKEQGQYESAFEIVLKNAKPEAVTVTVQEPIPGDWKMLKTSHPHDKVASNTAQWRITVPAEGATTLSYRVRVRH
mgnify:FL=1